MTVRKSSSVMRRSVASRVTPALLTMTSSRPSSATQRSTMAWTSDSDVTSQRTARARVALDQLRRRLLGGVEVHVADDDGGTLTGERLDDGPPDSLRGAGDDRGLAIQQTHEQHPCDWARRWPCPAETTPCSHGGVAAQLRTFVRRIPEFDQYRICVLAHHRPERTSSRCHTQGILPAVSICHCQTIRQILIN